MSIFLRWARTSRTVGQRVGFLALGGVVFLGIVPLLLLGLGVELALILAIVYTPPGNEIFATQAFPPAAWGLMIVLALAFAVLEETRKYLVRRYL